MSKPLKVILFTLLLSLVFYTGMRFEKLTGELSDIGKPSFTTKVIRFSVDEVVYLTKKRWGISGNHEEKYITTKRYEEANASEKIAFPGEGSLIYKVEPDKLIIYSRNNSSEMNEIESDIKIEIIIVGDTEWKKYYDKINSEMRVFE